MDETHFSLLLSTLLSSNIRDLTLDQNPLIPENLLGYLLTDDTLLKHLSLRMNGIGDVGAKALATSLKTNRTLLSLNLWYNKIDVDGAVDLAEVCVDI
jgi:Ran GTPase-activating protein (RanGAP) involved in mRNA processing and transport